MSVDLYHFFNPYLNRDVSGPITLSSEWTEIVPKEPLRAERQINDLVLVVAEPFEPDYEHWALRLGDGSIVKPEVQLVDEKGNTYNLTSPAIGLKEMELGILDLPKDRVYRTIRIRANKPLKLSKIYWHCYNQWDVS